MRTTILGLVLFAATSGPAAADTVSCTTIDLSGLDAPDGVGRDDEASAGSFLAADDEAALAPRFYLAGIVGASFATLTQPDLPESNAILNQTLFTAGGAAGWAFDRPWGQLRAEFEARGRERMQFTESDPIGGTVSFHAYDGWSTMANLWRDLDLTDRGGIYVGGGIGAGGYRSVFSGDTLGTTVSGSTGITSFAWQAGGGATYAVNDRVTFDLGYRFFSLGPGLSDIRATTASGTIEDTVKNQFSASELLLTLRIYEPFRRWR